MTQIMRAWALVVRDGRWERVEVVFDAEPLPPADAGTVLAELARHRLRELVYQKFREAGYLPDALHNLTLAMGRSWAHVSPEFTPELKA